MLCLQILDIYVAQLLEVKLDAHLNHSYRAHDQDHAFLSILLFADAMEKAFLYLFHPFSKPVSKFWEEGFNE